MNKAKQERKLTMESKLTVREVVISALEICVVLALIGYVGVVEIIGKVWRWVN
ncbi:hypothetical protein ES705_34976 [subsurface metagenome]